MYTDAACHSKSVSACSPRAPGQGACFWAGVCTAGLSDLSSAVSEAWEDPEPRKPAEQRVANESAGAGAAASPFTGPSAACAGAVAVTVAGSWEVAGSTLPVSGLLSMPAGAAPAASALMYTAPCCAGAEIPRTGCASSSLEAAVLRFLVLPRLVLPARLLFTGPSWLSTSAAAICFSSVAS